MPKREARPYPLSRPPLERMLRIHQAIQSGAFPNASTLARELEVSSKSVHRDLEFMRDRFELPIAYNATRFGYHYTAPVSSFPALQITEGELFALVVAEKALQQYRGTNFEKPLLSAFKKMSAALPDTVSLSLSEWDQSISFRTSAEPLLDLATFDILGKATAQCQQLKLRYRKPGQTAAEERIVDPYHVANINGEWFLFAYDHLRHGLRTFVPARILAVERTGKKFKRPEKFSVEASLRDSFGVHSGQQAVEVVIHFMPAAADYIREKRWHSSQKLTDRPDGGVELRFQLSSLAEVERWILSWGGQAIPIAPPGLVAAVEKSALALLQATVSTERG